MLGICNYRRTNQNMVRTSMSMIRNLMIGLTITVWVTSSVHAQQRQSRLDVLMSDMSSTVQAQQNDAQARFDAASRLNGGLQALYAAAKQEIAEVQADANRQHAADQSKLANWPLWYKAQQAEIAALRAKVH